MNKLRSFAKRYQLLEPGDHVLLAISGGLDSVAMGWMFYQLGHPFAIAHCNFKLRGTDSDDDENFVRDLAKQWDVRFHSSSFTTQQHARAAGISIQMAARDLRYQYFKSLQGNYGYQKVATAHHVDDAFETILLNMAHGTGFQGLMGIVPKKGQLIRPMLAFNRQEIRELAAESGIQWREDSSNEKDYYERNKVRHHILPVLKELNPSFSHTLRDTIERIWASGVVLEEAVIGWEEKNLQADAKQAVVEIGSMKPAEQLLLYECLKRRTGLHYKTFQQLLESVEAGISGKQFYTGSHVINYDRNKLLIHQLDELQPMKAVEVGSDAHSVPLPAGTLAIRSIPMPVEIETNEKIALLDFDKLVFPLEVRAWQQGDTFVPLGMKGQKKLSDFMIDSKIPVNLKGQVLVLVSAGQIAWVIGRRIDDRFKIDSSTRTVYRLELC